MFNKICILYTYNKSRMAKIQTIVFTGSTAYHESLKTPISIQVHPTEIFNRINI